MKKKIFKFGKYKQGDFSKEKALAFFEKAKESDFIFAHSSHWKKKNQEPLNIGKANGFTIEGEEVYANFELNEKGKEYYNDGTLTAISVELDPDKGLMAIAGLPIGVNPAIKGAEFEFLSGEYAEFEEMDIPFVKVCSDKREFEVMTVWEIIEAIKSIDVTTLLDTDKTALQDAVWILLDNAWIQKTLTAEGYTVTKNVAEMEEKFTKEQIREEIRKEFEREQTIKDIMENSKGKITQAMEKILEFALKNSNQDNIVEFEEGKKEGELTAIKNLIEKAPKLAIFEKLNIETKTITETATEKAFNVANIINGGK